MPKGCWSFAGMVNFFSMFCPELQKLLKPIYDLTKKGSCFILGKEQQETFEEITRKPSAFWHSWKVFHPISNEIYIIT